MVHIAQSRKRSGGDENSAGSRPMSSSSPRSGPAPVSAMREVQTADFLHTFATVLRHAAMKSELRLVLIGDRKWM